ncbi:MAG: pseudouridine-5'-phosphate glycosidase [Granulosicoccus sp.]
MLEIASEVQDAIASNRAVVALESTIITHGMPYPENIETALRVEKTVRDNNAIPATIAVIDGHVRVGLPVDDIEKLATSEHVMKLSRADLAMALARKADGSTTVAATMIVARLAGISVFATGGIGGVHRGAESSFDISADLQELARTSVSVVCAGAKAILDLPKTLEVLETLGVPVLAWQQDNLPAFWSKDSGLKAPLRVDSVNEIVSFLQARQSLTLAGGVLIANPVPQEHEIAASIMSTYIDQAVREADSEGISGKQLTPWLLTRIVELTDGQSLETNQMLIINNARLASKIAVANEGVVL